MKFQSKEEGQEQERVGFGFKIENEHCESKLFFFSM